MAYHIDCEIKTTYACEHSTRYIVTQEWKVCDMEVEIVALNVMISTSISQTVCRKGKCTADRPPDRQSLSKSK